MEYKWLFNIFNSGLVGIGTTIPMATLHLHDLSLNNNSIIIENSQSYLIGSDGIALGIEGESGYLKMQRARTLNFLTDNAIRLSILANGNIGIGTTNPTAKLHIVGLLKYEDGNQNINRVLTSDKYWAGIGYIGYQNYRIGRNSEIIRNIAQNKIAHDILMGGDSPYFKVLPIAPSNYFSFGSKNPYTLW